MSLFKILLILVSFLFGNAFAQDNSIEHKIKAAYLYNFTKFITWPDGGKENFHLCILGEDPFGQIIDPIEKRWVKNKAIQLLRLKSLANVDQCQMVFFADPTQITNLPGILTVHSLPPLLTVGDGKKFTQQGGMIAFFLEKGKVKLFINVNAIKRNNLQISAKLLEVAQIIDGESND